MKTIALLLRRGRSISLAILVFSLLVGLTTTTQAQNAGRVNNYVPTTFSGGFQEISSSGSALFTYPYGSYYTAYTNQAGSVQIPFDFNYDSVSYPAGSRIYCRFDATVGFQQNYNYNFGSGITDGSMPNQIMMWSYYQDAFLGYKYPASGVYYQTVGTAPNRVFIIEYNSVAYYGYYGYYYGYYISEETKFYETSNNIEILYSQNNKYMYYSYTGNIGITGNTSPTYAYNAQVSTGGSFGTHYTPKGNFRFACPLVRFDRNLSTSPKTLTISNTLVGSTTTANVVATHVGTEQPLTISAATLSGSADFTVESVPAPLNPGESGNIVVKFQPTIVGNQTATLTVVSNGRDSGTQTVTINATGLAPLISVDTNILFKKSYTKMGQSFTKRLIIKNYGSGDLLWNSFTLTGMDANQYAVTQYPTNNPIVVGGIDSVFITYTPTIEGRHISALYINSNALNNPSVKVDLIGTGILPHIVVTPNAVRFDSTYEGDTVSKQVTIWNPGTDTLRINPNILAGADPDFTLAGLTGADTMLPPDKKRTVTITFIPKQMGTRQGRYLLKTNIIPTFEAVPRDTAGTISIPIYGNGVPFGVLSQSISGATYDTTTKGSEICRMDTLRNDGDADIVLQSWSITGSNAADFTASGITFPYLLKARSSVIVNVCGTPSDFGLRNANLAIMGTSSNRSVSVSLDLNVYGLKVCASTDPVALFTDEYVVENSDSTECITVTNCGELPAVYTANLSNLVDYSVTPSQSASVPAGGTATFCVKFTPTTYGASNASLKISTANIPDMVVPITGIGACANVSAPQPAIAGIGAGGHQPFTVTLSNAGNYTWTADANNKPTITPNDGVFTLSDVTPIAGNNGQLVVNGTFNPTEISKTYSATVSFPNAEPACASAVTVTLSAQSTSASVSTKVEQDGFSLGQNYPNPFASATTFNYTTPTEAPVMITISDITGHAIRTIASGRISAGEHTVSIDANDLASGTYVVTLSSGSVRLVRQMVVTK